MRDNVGRIRPDRLLKEAQSLAVTLQEVERRRQIVERFGRIRISLDRPAEKPRALVEPALLCPKKAESVKRIKIAGSARENGPIERRRFVEPTSLMQFSCLTEGLSERMQLA